MLVKPKGCHDLYGSEAKKWQYLNKVIETLMEKYNYQYIRTPIFESSEVFHRGIGDSTDVVRKETYDFKDRGDRTMTLRPEGTAGVVRSYIENKMYADSAISKLYYNGTMYRYERPQSGRDREFTQFGVEVLGSDSPYVDAEVISIGVNLLKLLGLKEIKVNINTLGDSKSREKYRDSLVEYFRPHLDELCEDCKERFKTNPLRILDCKVDKDNEILKNAPRTIDHLNEESRVRFEKVKLYLQELEVDYEVNTSLVRGLDYYNHTVFEIEAKVEGFGSNNVLGGGGRYNGLVKLLGGPDTCGMGFAMGLGRLIQAIDLEEVKLPIEDELEVFVMAVSETERMYALSLVQSLRMNGFRVDMDYNDKSLKGQFKIADRYNSKYYLFLNDEDLQKDEVKIKNSKTKEEVVIQVDYLMYYLDEMLQDDDYDSCDCGCDHDDHECNCHGEDHDCDDDHECHCHKH